MAEGDNANRGIVTTAVARRTISPYDLSPSDNPGCVISQPILRGTNYEEWAANLKLALMARKKFGFVDGSIPRPATDSGDFEDWMCNNALVISWIRLTVEASLRTTLQTVDIAHDLWELIRRRFSVKNGTKVSRVKSDLAMAQQGGRTVENYFGYLHQLWSTLADFRRPKTCRCGNCTCNLSAEIEKEREEDCVHDFLRGLNEQYTQIRSILLSRVPFPSLDDAYLAVTQEEDSRMLNTRRESLVNEVSFATQSSVRPAYRGDKTKLTCSVCGRSGHLAENCFRVVGYPDWWPDKSKSGGSLKHSPDPRKDLRPTVGNRNSASADRNRGPPSRPRTVGVVNSVRVEEQPHVPVANAVLRDDDRTGMVGLTDVQWKSLTKLLAEHEMKEEKSHNSGTDFSGSWIFDTGASNHMTGSEKFLENICDMYPVHIRLPDGHFSVAKKKGSVRLGNSLKLENVYCVDGLSCHLISVSQLTRDRYCVFQITDKICVVQDRITKILIGAGECSNGLYFFRSVDVASAVQGFGKTSAEVMHRRLGHPSSKAMARLKLSGVSFLDVFDTKVCEICIRAKQTRDSFPLSSNKTTEIFELIHVDLWGPYRNQSMCGARYFLTIVDDYSRAVWLHLLPTKTAAPATLKSFVALVKRQFNKKIKTVRSDNGSEFVALSTFFREKGIFHETSCVATPQQNGRVERKHRHILNVARALRFQANLPIEFWGYCALTACYLINRTPTEVLKGKTPYEIIHNTSPPLDHLRVFGSVCYVHNNNHNGDKFASRSSKCIFIGYPPGKKGWRVYNLETKKISVSRDVVFIEDEFAFPKSTYLSPSLTPAVADGSLPPVSSPVILDEADDVTPVVMAEPIIPDTTMPLDAQVSFGPRSDVENNSSPSPVPPRQSQRARKPNVRLSDYIVSTNLVSSAQPSISGVCYPLSEFDSCSRFSSSHRAYLHALVTSVEPKSYRQAMDSAEWSQAVRNEISALEDNGTWTIEKLPKGKKAIGCQWVFKLKLKSDGSIERHKARLVVLGNKQVEGTDYDETFAPVAKMTTVRCVLAVAAAKNWEIFQMDVHNAFLHGDLNEEVYMRLPPGFTSTDKTDVCRLKKSLYGLKQAPRCWFEKLRASLVAYGFHQAQADHSLFTFVQDDVRINLLVYVDDLILTGNSATKIQEFKAYLSSCFRMKDLGVLKYFLGLEVARNASGIYLCQRKYTLDIITECGLLGAKPSRFPLDQNHRLALANGEIFDNPTAYRRLIGRLIYLRETRPELSYSIHVLSQFMQNPLQAHWDAALRVVRYLKLNPGQGILLRSDSSLDLKAWCDADYAGCPLTRRSLTGWFIQLGESPVSWKTKKQPTVSLSSAEAEYRAMQFTVKEIVWLRALLTSLGVLIAEPVHLFCDNKAAIHIAANPVFHERTKHVEADCHFVRDKVLDGTVSTKYVTSQTQLADIFTKALGSQEFESFVSKLGILNLHAPA